MQIESSDHGVPVHWQVSWQPCIVHSAQSVTSQGFWPRELNDWTQKPSQADELRAREWTLKMKITHPFPQRATTRGRNLGGRKIRKESTIVSDAARIDLWCSAALRVIELVEGAGAAGVQLRTALKSID